VHKGDLTGIEIINRLAEQVWASDVTRLEDHRAVELVQSRDSRECAGVLLIDMRTGEFVLVEAKAVLLATGGGPTMYRYHTPSGDKSCDGMAMALRAGLVLRDMEMVQFHPTGLLAGADTRMTGTVLEEGLRGAGGYLLGGDGERFMPAYDERAERATRDIVSRAMDEEMRKGNTTPLGGLYLQMSHLGADEVRARFKGMVQRCADCGFDLAGERVEVVPTAHYMMGGVQFAVDGSTALPGLYAAGEDTGGVHGANRLGGNGVANSTVFGALAGATLARSVAGKTTWAQVDDTRVETAVARSVMPLGKSPGDLHGIRERLYAIMWDDVGIVRDAAGLARAAVDLAELDTALDHAGVGVDIRTFNLSWHDWLNLKNLILVSRSIATAANVRRDSCGAHYRSDFPDAGSPEDSTFTCVHARDGDLHLDMRPVEFSRVRPGESLISQPG
jgi:fumarate reductase flavoprotein subunit